MAAPKQSRHAVDGSDLLATGMRIVASEQGTTTTLEFEGASGPAERDTTRAEVERALERGPQCVVLDLSGVDSIDSHGVDIVVSAARRCAERGVHVVIIPGPPPVQRVFEICQLTHLLPFASQA